mgnify:FL=1
MRPPFSMSWHSSLAVSFIPRHYDSADVFCPSLWLIESAKNIFGADIVYFIPFSLLHSGFAEYIVFGEDDRCSLRMHTSSLLYFFINPRTTNHACMATVVIRP